MKEEYKAILEEIRAIRGRGQQAPARMTDRNRVVSLIKEIQVVLMPAYYHYKDMSEEEAFERLVSDLSDQLWSALCFSGQSPLRTEALTDAFLQRLPKILNLLETDIQAIYDGDPAAKTKAEVVLCYPGFYAICIYRIAHELYDLNVPYIPRIMTEYAHEKTGIDINPGAKIGEYFCIDHGTGIVIGETAVLGHHVKLYQGVTIGARSFEKDEYGNPVKGGKRHPDIGDHVVIYANATILGGDTHIGSHSVIGGNVWLLKSVPENSRIYYTENYQGV